MLKLQKRLFLCESCFLSAIFFVHIFTLERYRNNFIEYDAHFITLLLSSFLIFKIVFSGLIGVKIQITFSYIDIFCGALLMYVTLQTFANGSIDMRLIYRLWLCYILYFIFKSYLRKSLGTFVIYLFILLGICLQIILLFLNISIFVKSIYWEGLSVLNSGINANYLASITPFIFALIFCEKKLGPYYRIIRYLSLTLFCTCIFLIIISQSRTAWLASTIGTTIVISYKFNLLEKATSFIQKAKWKYFFYLILTFFLLLIFVLLYAYKPKSVDGRALIYTVSIEMFQISPFFGIGLNKFEALYNVYQANYFRTHNISPSQQLLADNSYFAFNEFLQFAIELGIIGLGLIMLLLFAILKSSKQYLITGKHTLKNFITCGAMAGIVAVTICCLFSYPLHIWSVAVMCILYIAILSFYHSENIATFRIRPLMYLFLVPILGHIALKEYKMMYSLDKWQEAAYLSLTNKFIHAEYLYKEIYPILKDDGRFLLNYGSELAVHGKYNESLNVLEIGKKHLSSSNLYLYLASNNEVLGNFSKAEHYYRLASDIVPSKFRPKQYLLQFYITTKNWKKASKLAEEIIKFPVKIPSPEVQSIKSNAHEFLREFKEKLDKQMY